MAKLKVLPKALIVGGILATIAFGVIKFVPDRQVAQEIPQQSVVIALPETQNGNSSTVGNSSTQRFPSEDAYPRAVPETQNENSSGAVSNNEEQASNVKLPGAGIASGQKTGTNWPMVDDIVRFCSTDNYPLRNVITNGTLDNINKVYTDRNSQFGIAQVDGLVAQAKVDPKMMSRVVSVFPFFSVEIHAIAVNGSPINSLEDLAGKRVIEGPEGSGTNITVQQIKRLTGIKWITVDGNLSQKDGLAAVQNGAADVEFIVAGQPIQVLTGAKGLKLIPIKHPALDKAGFYTPTNFPTGAYPWHGHSSPTYKVDNVLITFAYKNQYQTEIANLVTCITKNIDNLQNDGHPKWRDVDALDIERSKWPVHPSALAAIKRTVQQNK